MCKQQGVRTGSQDSAAGRRPFPGFTLVEILVAIAVIVLLMTILVPALQRVRRQAGAVVCQSNLRQWALIHTAYADDYDGRFWRTYDPGTERPGFWVAKLASYYKASPDLLLCPLAAQAEPMAPESDWHAEDFGDTGTTFSAWRLWYYNARNEGPIYQGSYAHNHFAMNNSPAPGRRTHAYPESFYWHSRPARNQAQIPLLTDGPWLEATHIDPNCPPPGDDQGATDACLRCGSRRGRGDEGLCGRISYPDQGKWAHQ